MTVLESVVQCICSCHFCQGVRKQLPRQLGVYSFVTIYFPAFHLPHTLKAPYDKWTNVIIGT